MVWSHVKDDIGTWIYGGIVVGVPNRVLIVAGQIGDEPNIIGVGG